MTLRFKGWINDPTPDFVINLAKGQAAQDLFVIAMTQGQRQGTWLELGAWQPIGGSNTYLLETRYDWSGVSIDKWDFSHGVRSQWEQIYDENRKPDWPLRARDFNDFTAQQKQQCRDTYLDVWMQATLNHIDWIEPTQRSWANMRPNTDFHQCDALVFDYDALPQHIDYLQIDIDPVANNQEMLSKLIPQHNFSVITFEHDLYMGSVDHHRARDVSRRLLWNKGYVLLAGDVAIEPYLIENKDHLPAIFEDWWVNPKYIKNDVIQLYQCPGPEPKYWREILTQEMP